MTIRVIYALLLVAFAMIAVVVEAAPLSDPYGGILPTIAGLKLDQPLSSEVRPIVTPGSVGTTLSQ
ncbi:hypothetical protein BGZ91_009273, partial [Linnemannia elongata]